MPAGMPILLTATLHIVAFNKGVPLVHGYNATH